LTSDAFTGVLNREGITISMDGKYTNLRLMEPLFRYATQGFHQPQGLYQQYQQRLKRGSADQLRLKLNVQLKLSGFLS